MDTDTDVSLVALPAEEAAVRRFLAEVWLPYNRALESTVEEFALAEGVDHVEAEVPFYLDELDGEDYRGWVAVEGYDGAPVAATDGEFVGFVLTDIEPSPVPFDRPDRLVVCDVYVTEPYRGTGLADRLFERARERARETGCEQFRLEVDADNERAMAFYERQGFRVARHEMLASVEES